MLQDPVNELPPIPSKNPLAPIHEPSLLLGDFQVGSYRYTSLIEGLYIPCRSPNKP